MVGVKGRSGRRGKISLEEFLAGKRPGALSWPKHLTARAGNYLNVLIELWLATEPERRFTVPPKIKRVLAAYACKRVIEIEIELEQHPEVLTIDGVDKILRLIKDTTTPLNYLQRTPGVVVIDVDDVLAWSRRLAPDITLRRKARRS
jgi:hypothetical protein